MRTTKLPGGRLMISGLFGSESQAVKFPEKLYGKYSEVNCVSAPMLAGPSEFRWIVKR